MNPKVLQLFKKYLAQEVLKGDSCEKKKVMGSKVVNVTKLLNDLSFWAEVERYLFLLKQSIMHFHTDLEILKVKRDRKRKLCMLKSTVGLYSNKLLCI